MVGDGRIRPGLSQELIFLDRDDDLGTVKAKLESAGADQVFLAVPRRAAALRTPLEFRILARMAHEISSETIVVTDDGDRRRMAREEGFRTRRSLRSVNHLMRPSGSRTWLPTLPELPIPSFGAILSVLMLLGLAAALNFYVLPVMTVRLVPTSREIEREFVLRVDPNAAELDPEEGVIPGEVVDDRIQIEGTGSTGGSRPIGQDRAKGEVEFSNRGGAVTLPQGTVVISKSQQRFTTDAELQIRAGGRNVAVPITAAEAGSGGNVAPGEINAADGSVPSTVTVTNSKPTSGGTDREAKVITQEDADKLKEELLKQARDQALRSLQTSAGEGRTVPPHSVQVTVADQSFDPAVGSESDQFGGRLSVRATGLSFANQDFNDLVTQMLLLDAPEGSDVGASGPQIGIPEVIDAQGGQVRLRVEARVNVLQQLETELIAEALQGRTVAQARTLLQDVEGLAEPPEVDVWPSWASKAYRVQVEVVTPD